MKNAKTFRNLIILVLILSLGTNIFLYVKYSYLKNTMVEIERVALNSYRSVFWELSGSSYEVLSEDNLSVLLDKTNLAKAYVHSIAIVRRSSTVHSLDNIAFNLTRQIQMLQMAVNKHGIETRFAKDLHATIRSEFEGLVDMIVDGKVDLEKLDNIGTQVGRNTWSYDMRYYSDFKDD